MALTTFGRLASAECATVPPTRDAQPDAAHIGDGDAHAGRLGEQREIGGDAMGHKVARADAVAGIFGALELLDRGLLDLADHPAERDVAGELDAGFDDRLDRDQRRGQSAFHVVGAEPEHPAVAEDRLRLEAVAGEMLLVAGIGRVHVAGEQEIEPVATPAPVSNRVRAALRRPAAGRCPCPTCACGRRDNARRRSPCRSCSGCSRDRSTDRERSRR